MCWYGQILETKMVALCKLRKEAFFQADQPPAREPFIEFQPPISPLPSALCTTVYGNSAKMY